MAKSGVKNMLLRSWPPAYGFVGPGNEKFVVPMNHMQSLQYYGFTPAHKEAEWLGDNIACEKYFKLACTS